MTILDTAPSTGTVPTLNAARPRPAFSAAIGAAASALSIAAAIAAVLTPMGGFNALATITAVAAAASVFVARGVADYIGPRPPIVIGLAAQALAVCGLLFLPGFAMLWAACAGLGLGVVLPASLAHMGGARTNGVATPRVVLPSRFVVPVAARSVHRGSVLLSVLAAGALATAWTVGGIGGIALALVGTAAIGIAVVRERRTVGPLGLAEAVGAVLVPALVVLAAATLVAALAQLALSTAMAVLPVIAVTSVAAAVALASRRTSGALAPAGRGSYRAATSGFDTTTKLTPALATVARTVADVQSAVAGTRAAGLGLRAHSTGHSAGTSAAFDQDALIKVLIDEPVTVDAAARTARIPAGTSWRDVVHAITPHGLGAPHGSSSHVGAIGYLLRGGLSAYGRTTGLAANSVISIEVVLASGEFVVADRERNVDLFWALRGGGGGLGIVTAVTVRLFDLARVVTGTAVWSAEHAPELAQAWRHWAADAPESITTSFRVLQFPALPGLPRVMSSGPLAVVDGTAVAPYAGDGPAAEAAALDLLARLRAVADPLLDSWKLASPYETPHTHMDPPIGLAHSGDSFILGDATGDAVAAFTAAARLEGSGLNSLELRQLGGALARRDVDGGAVSHLPGDFAYWGVGLHTRAVPEQRVRESLGTLRSALAPWDTGLVVPTFAPDASLPQRLFDDATRERVNAVRRDVDPDGLFARDIAPGAM